ncbi:MFS transporter [Romeria aff. gracilis LEGE 07310]|uniref:MFS transporter n=1 Tax=Vasconcelosia minhoensis LEGE 07310 TaxID=915328 RepID=A0A8J7AZ32_9CYAN|nr:MFS transporter [Romeria gracilis]MBE9079002.1 MFS transporter [Romeria aff. gracilis LEGE 07310]
MTPLDSVSLNLADAGLWLAQLGVPDPEELRDNAFIFSGPQFYTALLSGIVLAFGFQLLLTNFLVAAGVSVVAHSGSSSSKKSSSDDSSSGNPIRTISIAFGISTLIVVSLALFVACFLAVKLSLYNSPLLGVITGLVIWGTYFTLLVWVSSTTVGSMIGSVVKTATSSFQSLVGTATAALTAKTASNQIVSTAEAAAAAVRRELTSTIDVEDLQYKLQDYLGSLPTPEFDADRVEAEFDRLLRGSDFSDIEDMESLSRIDRQAFVDLVSSRTDLSKRDINRVADRLYKRWQRNLGSSRKGLLGELRDYIQSATPDRLLSQSTDDRLGQLIDELRQQRRQSSGSGNNNAAMMSQVFSMLSAVAMGRVDLSDFDVEKIIGKIREARSQVVSQADSLSAQLGDQPDASIFKADIENYLLNTYAWQMRGTRLEDEFRMVLFDPQADPYLLRQELEQVNRAYFADILKSRGLFTQTELRSISLRLDVVRQQLLREVIAAQNIQAEKQLLRETEIFFQLTPKEELYTDMGEQAFSAIAEDDHADAGELRARFAKVTPALIQQLLVARADINPDEAIQLSDKYQQILDKVAADSEGLQQSATVRADQQWQQLQDYLRSTNKAELSPEGIERDLKTLMHEPEAGIRRIRWRVTRFNRDTLVQLLSQRNDLSEQEVNQIIDHVESNWYSLRGAPQAMTAQAQAKYNEASSAIADYLRSTGKSELNPEGIKRDLQTLVENPQVGAKAVRARLARMDRDTLVQLLNQRDDLTEAEINQTIDQLLDGIQTVLQTPRRLARRAQAQVMSFESALEDYLRSTDKAELNPEGIKRDLQVLLDDPRLGAERIGERLSRMDRSTMIALLAQREDMTEAEAAQTVDQVLSVRDQFVAQVRQIQLRIEAMIDSIFARIRRYLNSLDRPELNYEGVSRDVRTLFDDPQAGFDALRDRLSQFDRNTLIAIISSNDRISQADAEQVVGQVESARDSVLRRAERLEYQLQARLNDLKLQAQRQVEETQRAAEAAAWWLFATALISAIAAGVGGGLAV